MREGFRCFQKAQVDVLVRELDCSRQTRELNAAGAMARGHFRKHSIAHQIARYYHKGRMQTISLKLPEDLLADLNREAKARRVTKSVVVRESLEKALRGRSRRGIASCYDLARDLAGRVKGLPRDLATNPNYMEGFGE